MMSSATRKLPPGAVNCRPGDYLLKRSGEGWRVFEVESLIAIDHLIPIGDRHAVEFLEERHARDSEPARGAGEVYILVTCAQKTFGSREIAVEAVETGNLGAAVPHVCLNISEFPAAATTVHRRGP